MKKNIQLEKGYVFGIIGNELHIIKEITEKEAVAIINKNNTWERADDIVKEIELKMSSGIENSIYISKLK